MKIWLLPVQFESLWSPYVVLLILLELQALCWRDMERVESLVLFLILMESLWVSLHLIWCWQLACYILPLLCLLMFLVSLISPRPLSWRGVGFLSKAFQHLMKWSCGFFLPVYLYDGYPDRFSYVESSLNLWDEADLVMVDNFLMCSWIWIASVLLTIFCMREIGL